MLATLLDRSRTEYVPKDQIAGIYLALGNVEEAIRWCEAAMNERHWFTVFQNSDPLGEELRDDPRFRRLLAHMNAPS